MQKPALKSQFIFVALIALILIVAFSIIESGLVSASSTRSVTQAEREFFPSAKAVTGGRATVHAAGRSSSGFRLLDGADLQGRLKGDATAMQALMSGSAQPTGLASDDLNNDGAPDVVAGFSAGGQGVIALYQGNIDAFATSSPAVYQAIQSGRIPPSFDPTIQVFNVPESPDFMVTGDFNHDGNKDILAAARGGGMYLLPGDGQGGFGAAMSIALPGQVTALTSGQFNKADGFTDVAVGITGSNGASVLVFDGASGGVMSQPSSLSLSSQATSLAFENLDNDAFSDMAVAAGSEVVIVHGIGQGKSSNLNLRSDNVNVGFNIRSMATGSFVWNRDNKKSIALLGDDGNIHLLQRNDLDTRAFTPAESAAIKRNAITGSRSHQGPITRVKTGGSSLGTTVQWSLGKQLNTGLTSSASSQMIAAQISPREVTDLLIVDQTSNSIQIIRPPDGQDQLSPISMSVEGSPTAVLAMPAKVNGERDLMVMRSGQSSVTSMTIAPHATITVNRTDDARVSTCAGGANDCSLRGAIDFANANPGTTIYVPAGNYALSLATTFEQGNANGDLDVNASGTTIVGAGAGLTTIRQMVADRVLDVNFNSTQQFMFGLSGVTLASGQDQSGLGGGAMLTGGLSNSYSITNCIFDSNAATNAEGGALNMAVGGSLNMTGSTFTNNGLGTTNGGAVSITDGNATAHFNRFVNNVTGASGNAVFTSGGIADFSDNWWANIGGPKAGDAMASGGLLKTSPSLTLSLTPDSQKSAANSSTSSTTITAAFQRSNGRNASNLGVVVGLPVTFNSTSGSITDSDATVQSTGTASATLSSGASKTATATIDGATASIGISAFTIPTLDIAFGAASIPLNGKTSLTFTIGNNGDALHNVTFTDTLPAGMVIANPANYHDNGACFSVTTDATTPGSSSANTTVGTVPGNALCSFSVDVTSTTNGIKTNTTGAITSTEAGPGGTATATLNVDAPPVLDISFSSPSVKTTQPSGLQITISNPGTNPDNLTNVSLTANLPVGIHVNSTSQTPICLGIGSGPATGTVTLTNPSTITLTGAAIAPNTSCQFVITIRTDAHGVYPVSFAATSDNGGTGNTASATLTVSDAPTVTSSFSGSTVPLNGTTTLTINITNPNTTSLSSLSFTDTLPAGLQVASPSNLSNTCGGTATATAGSGTVSLTGGGLTGSGSCKVTVDIKGTTVGTKNNSVQVNSSQGGLSNTSNTSITVVAPPDFSIVFGAASIPVNGKTSLTFTISNSGNALHNVSFTDTFPSEMVVANPANLQTNGACFSLTTSAATPGSNSANTTVGTVPGNAVCSFSVDVTSTTNGIKTNTTGAITSDESGPGGTASASVTVVAPPTLAAAVGAASIPLNGSTSLTFTIQNPNAGTALTSVGFNIALPSGLLVSTPSGLSTNCGGTSQALNSGGQGLISLVSVTVAANSSCTLSVNVTGTTAGTKNLVTSQIGSNEGGNGAPATASITVATPPTFSMAFNPNPIALGATTSLTFTITNPAGNPSALTGVSFTDTLPSGLTVASASTTVCGGTLTLTNPTSISLANATIAINTQCVFSVTVTGAAAGQYTNTTSAITSTNGGTGNAASANLSVTSPPTIIKLFGAPSIPLNGTTTLTFNINNPNTATALTGIAFTDNFPSGIVVAGTPNASNTCGGTFSAAGGASAVTLSGGTLAANSGCSISLTVQGTTAGVKNNSTQITSTEGGTGNTTNASITVVAPPVIIKAFGAASVPLSGSTSLTFTIQNNNTTVGLTGVGFSDTFPAGLVVATPNGLSGSCGAGTITAVAGAGSVSLTGGTIAANSSCSFSINVTGTTTGIKNNTTSQVTSIEGGTGGTASASLAVEGPPTITKSFNPTTIAVNATTSLSFTITNPASNPIALTGVAFTDVLPAGLTVSNASATVCGGTVTLTAPNTIALSGASINPGSTCPFSVAVTGTSSGQFTNTTGNVTSTNGGTGNTATATLTVASPPTIVKIFGVGTMPVNQTTSLSFTVTNPNSGLGLTGVGFVDNLPAGLVVATPNALAGSCGAGTVTAVAGSGSIGLSGGTLAASSSCTFSVNVTATSQGAKLNTTGPVSATESGAGGTASASINVTLRTTSTAVSFSANPVVNGQVIQVTATVTDTDIGPKSSPAGTVNISSAAVTDQIVPTSCTLSPVNSTTSSCTVNLSSTTINTHGVTAAYLGSAVHAPSSGTSQLTVNKANTNSVLVSSANPSVFGQPVTLTVTVSAAAPGAGTPTGTVTFLDGVNSIGTAPLVAGVGTITLSNFSVGTHPISVTYPGDGNFNGSTSNTVNQVVNKDATTTALASSVNPTEFGQNVTFTATVTANAPGAGTPTGTVTFFDGATQIGTGTLSGGVTTFSTATLAVGTHPITAVYSGDGNFLTSTSSVVNQVVNKATTATTLVSSVNPSVFGQSVTFTATVVSTGPPINNPGGTVNRAVKTRTVNARSVVPEGIGTPSGTVTFFDGATQIGTATLNNSGVGTFTTSALSVGTHPITAVYGGDASFLTSTSNVVNQVVNKANTTTANVTSSANPSVFGQPVTLSTTVAAAAPGSGIPTGTVTFFDGVTQIGTATLNGSGVASITISTFSVGSHSITASYGGDGNFNGSTTAAATVQVVNKANTTTVVVASSNPAFVHTTVTFTATVLPVPPGAGVPTGTVQFKDNGVNIGGPVALVAGTASVNESNLSPGNHAITAVYSGDGNFNPSTGTFAGGLNVGFKFVDNVSGNTLIVIPPANGASGTGTFTWIHNGTTIVNNAPCGVEFNQFVLRVRSNVPSLNGVFDATIQSGQAILFTQNTSFVLNTNTVVLQ